jgi:hypothetical protein
MLAAESAHWWWRRTSRFSIWLAAAPAIVLFTLGLQGAWSTFRLHGDGDVRAALNYTREHWQTGDRLFVYYAAEQPFAYYAPRLGFTPTDYVVGRCSNDLQRTDVWQLDQLRGRPRVWVVTLGTDGTARIFRYLAAIGTVREMFPAAGDGDMSSIIAGAAVLYDMSHPASSITPATINIPGEPETDSVAWDCYGVFRPVTKTPA